MAQEYEQPVRRLVIKQTHVQILKCIGNGSKPRIMARELGVKEQSLITRLKTLIKHEYVERQGQKRNLVIKLTHAGRAVLEGYAIRQIPQPIIGLHSSEARKIEQKTTEIVAPAMVIREAKIEKKKLPTWAIVSIVFGTASLIAGTAYLLDKASERREVQSLAPKAEISPHIISQIADADVRESMLQGKPVDRRKTVYHIQYDEESESQKA